jgi:hypothetical protein
MLASRPDQRFHSAATVAAELRAVAAILEARATAEEAEMESRRRWADKRQPSRTIWVAGVLVACIVIALWVWHAQLLNFFR